MFNLILLLVSILTGLHCSSPNVNDSQYKPLVLNVGSSDIDVSKGESYPRSTLKQASIVGKWMNSIAATQEAIELTANGSIRGVLGGMILTGTYQYSGSQLVVNAGGQQIIFTVDKLTSSWLWLTPSNGQEQLKLLSNPRTPIPGGNMGQQPKRQQSGFNAPHSFSSSTPTTQTNEVKVTPHLNPGKLVGTWLRNDGNVTYIFSQDGIFKGYQNPGTEHDSFYGKYNAYDTWVDIEVMYKGSGQAMQHKGKIYNIRFTGNQMSFIDESDGKTYNFIRQGPGNVSLADFSRVAAMSRSQSQSTPASSSRQGTFVYRPNNAGTQLFKVGAKNNLFGVYEVEVIHFTEIRQHQRLAAGYKFVNVEVVLRKLKSDYNGIFEPAIKSNSNYAFLLTSDGAKYSKTYNAAPAVPLPLASVGTGEAARGQVMFMVPMDAQLAGFVYSQIHTNHKRFHEGTGVKVIF